MLRELRRRAPRLPVVLMSGYALGETAAEIPAPDVFLRKPFQLGDLAQSVRRLLSPAGAPQG